jgi:UDP-N-acetylglucosamine--N-acetylmuramyl-(pentapeptide) pyrophosphoryl-undecaprenol N-acetylglucosamine transferase
VIARAGAMTVAEICVAQKPTVFVPYPFAAEDHQTVNAQELVKFKAALMVKDSEAQEKLVPTLISLATDEKLQHKMKGNLALLAMRDADKKIAREILKRI